jgi:hypothetical protein
MYTVDDRDTVTPLGDFPQSCTGAPCPVLVADESTLVLAYYLAERRPHVNGPQPRSIGIAKSLEPIAIVQFDSYTVFTFGPPNDEAFRGHPLAERGLEPYGAFEIEHSSWVRALERMNAVHPRRHPDMYAGRRHFVLSFHDSTFECVAEGIQFTLTHGSLSSVLPQMQALLEP